MSTDTDEFRYGDNKTIHGTTSVNVERAPSGEVVAVWFRCMRVPFTDHMVDDDRAKEMRGTDKPPSVKAIVFNGAECDA